jgi:hypothetical protein
VIPLEKMPHQEFLILDGDQIQRFKNIVKLSDDRLLWVADWLSHLSFLSESQVIFVLNLLKDFANLEAVAVAIGDSRWLLLADEESAYFFDLNTLDKIDNFPVTPVTMIACELCNLFSKMKDRRRQWKKHETLSLQSDCQQAD